MATEKKLLSPRQARNFTKREEERMRVEETERERIQSECAAWPVRVRTVLEAATSFEWPVKFGNNFVCIHAPSSYDGNLEELAFPFIYDCSSRENYQLSIVEESIASENRRREEFRKREQLRAAARAKLTDEEAQALGLR